MVKSYKSQYINTRSRAEKRVYRNVKDLYQILLEQAGKAIEDGETPTLNIMGDPKLYKKYERATDYITNNLLSTFSKDFYDWIYKSSTKTLPSSFVTFDDYQVSMDQSDQLLAKQQSQMLLESLNNFNQDMFNYVYDRWGEGVSPKNITEDILEHFDSISENKAKFIARNITSTLQTNYNLNAMRNAGITQAKAFGAGDSRQRVGHKRNNGKIFDLSVGLYDSEAEEYYLPGQPYNCRCGMIPIV